jgi:hypothetical protein
VNGEPVAERKMLRKRQRNQEKPGKMKEEEREGDGYNQVTRKGRTAFLLDEETRRKTPEEEKADTAA